MTIPKRNSSFQLFEYPTDIFLSKGLINKG